MDCLRYDFEVLQGSSFARDLEYQIQGEPVDIEGYTARMKVRKSYELPVEIELTTANNRITISETNQIDITLSAADTAALKAGRYLYDLELVNGDYVERILQGMFTVQAEVTKRQSSSTKIIRRSLKAMTALARLSLSMMGSKDRRGFLIYSFLFARLRLL